MAGSREPGSPGDGDLDLGVEDEDLAEREEAAEAEDDDAADEGAEEGVGADDGGSGQYGEDRTSQAARGQGDRVGTRRTARQHIQHLETQLRETRTQIEELRRFQQQPPQPSQADLERQRQARDERRLMMTQPELAADIERELRQEFGSVLQQQQVALWDRSDKGDFDRELDAKPQLRRFEARVEELRRIAPGVSRLDLLDKAIGEAARRNIGPARTRTQRQANERAAGQVTRPGGVRGDVAGNRQRTGRSAAQRLDGVPI